MLAPVETHFGIKQLHHLTSIPNWYQVATMKLADYLQLADKSRASFAAEIGVDEVTVGRYIRGERRPRWQTLARIKEVTSGQVTANDFTDVPGEQQWAHEDSDA